MSRRFIAYYRVSTTKQGNSGLGLEAQVEAVQSYLRQNNGVPLGEYVEIESGARSERPQLKMATDACRKEKAVLVIAKLDRLARNVHFISGLMESGIEFVAADNPHANRLMLHLLAAFAEHERDQISRRTKDALAAAKRRGATLGSFGKVLAQRNQMKAKNFARNLAPTLDAIDPARKLSLRNLASELNIRGSRTVSGACWNAMTVYRLKRRIAEPI